MQELFGPLPAPLMIGLMVLAAAITLLACMPTAWVDKAHRKLQKTREKKP